MSLMANLCKRCKRSDVEQGSGFNPPAILFIPKATTLKTDNTQEFNLCVLQTSKQSTYKFEAYTFLNRTAEDVLEWENRLAIVIKNKPMETTKSKFDLVEAIIKGDAPTHWQEFKCVEITRIPKNLDGTDGVAPGICMETYKVCLDLVKKQYFPQNAARLQKDYLCNHIKKPNKLLVTNTAARLGEINCMLSRFPVPNNDPMAKDKLCNILYCMVKHNWHEALCKSGRTASDMTIMELEGYFEQIELLDTLKQKGLKTIV
eukprot:9567400-Ditylum_brightwellii.AAC.1